MIKIKSSGIPITRHIKVQTHSWKETGFREFWNERLPTEVVQRWVSKLNPKKLNADSLNLIKHLIGNRKTLTAHICCEMTEYQPKFPLLMIPIAYGPYLGEIQCQNGLSTGRRFIKTNRWILISFHSFTEH